MTETVCELKYGPLNGTCVVIPDDMLAIALESGPKWAIYRRLKPDRFAYLQMASSPRKANRLVWLAGSRMVRQHRRRTA